MSSFAQKLSAWNEEFNSPLGYICEIKEFAPNDILSCKGFGPLLGGMEGEEKV